ncbi:MAG TPA: NAD(P)/FAD-dependent oxidoreductase [Actinomycetota bacterium]|nr:NAD(P)/FAD-dependent oxidoreductase [Actinomycetota bacterium]
MEDVIVVGAGPAGLAAATWLGRYRRKTLVLDGGPPRNTPAQASHGYLGFDGSPPETLVAAARRDLERYPTVAIRPLRADDARRQGDAFVVATSEGDVVAHRLMLATGVRDALPDIPGFDRVYGQHAFHCSCCDGYESADQDVVAIGWGEHAAGFAIDLLEWGARVVLVTDGQEFEGDRTCEAALHRNGIEVIEEKVTRVVLDGDRMTSVELASGRSVPATRAFFSIKHHPCNELAVSLGCDTDEMGYITVGDHGETSVEGAYAAGDVTPGEQLVQRSAAEGAVAGIACAISLRGMSTASDAPEPGPDPEAELDAS